MARTQACVQRTPDLWAAVGIMAGNPVGAPHALGLAPQHRGIWGVSLPRIYPDAYPQAEPRVKFECWIEGSTIRIRTRDAKRIEVDLGPKGLNFSGSVQLIVNGKGRFRGVVPPKPLSLDL